MIEVDAAVDPVSKSQADAAAEAIRRAIRNGEAPSPECYAVVDGWRALHAVPLVKTTMSLRTRVARLKLKVPIAQRLKRKPQIVAKLSRGSTRLAQMQDIGGCRVICGDRKEMAVLAHRLESDTQTVKVRAVDDYTEHGRPDTGYRARHVIIEFDRRLIEIQLRTARQHAWAEAVERAATLTEQPLKDGQGPEEVLEFFRLASEAFWDLDNGRTVSATVRVRVRKLRRCLDDQLKDTRSRSVAARLPARHDLQTRTNQWLIIYNWHKAKFEHWLDLGSDEVQAAVTYAQKEAEYPFEAGYEVVLIGADSEKTIQQTHAHYFGRTRGDIDPHGVFKQIS